MNSYVVPLCALLALAALTPSASARQRSQSIPASKPAVVPVTPVLTPEQAMEGALEKQRASLDKQIQAIHVQLADKIDSRDKPATPVERFFVPLPSVNQSDCPALAADQVSSLISATAQKRSLNPALVRAVMKQESGFKPCAVSPMGAQGLMQLMPETARELHVKNVFDPQQNVEAGAAYLKQMLDRYNGDLRLALVAYNAGPGRADQAPGIPYPLETQNYVASVLAELGIDQFENTSAQEDLAPPEDSGAIAPIASEAKPKTLSQSATTGPTPTAEKNITTNLPR